MDEIMEKCCRGDGKPDFDKMRRFMQQCGKVDFSDTDVGLMQQFCDQDVMPDIAKMKQLIESCGCQIPEAAEQE